MRKIMYLTGTRADFGLMHSTLSKIEESPRLELSVCVTGMHLSSDFGLTIDEIKNTGFRICAEIKVDFSNNSGVGMAHIIADIMHGVVDVLHKEKPDMLVLLGDRGEMLAGAIAALHINIPIVHIHGGERSGTVDEPVRHAISKMAHFHFVTTLGSAQRLIRMGEDEKKVYIVGAPGLDVIMNIDLPLRKNIFSDLGLNPDEKTALIIFHPVVQEADQAGQQFGIVLNAIIRNGLQALILLPNSDAGSRNIRKVIEQMTTDVPNIKVFSHLSRDKYLGILSKTDILVGNSSSGIIEAASLGTPVVNIGKRQQCRERNENVIDVPELDAELVNTGIKQGLEMKDSRWENIYGDGNAGAKIVDLLETLTLDDNLFHKLNSY